MTPYRRGSTYKDGTLVKVVPFESHKCETPCHYRSILKWDFGTLWRCECGRLYEFERRPWYSRFLPGDGRWVETDCPPEGEGGCSHCGRTPATLHVPYGKASDRWCRDCLDAYEWGQRTQRDWMMLMPGVSEAVAGFEGDTLMTHPHLTPEQIEQRMRHIAALHRVSRPCDDPEDHLGFDPDDLPLSDNAASP